MTRYFLAAATVAGALSFATLATLATPAAACDFEYCVERPVCAVTNCTNPPVTVPQREKICYYTTDFTICV